MFLSYLQLHRLQSNLFRVFQKVLQQKRNVVHLKIQFTLVGSRDVYVCIQTIIIWKGGLAVVLRHTNLEQQLVLHDPLDRFDEQVIELQPVAQLLPQLLTAETDATAKVGMTAMAQNMEANGLSVTSKTIYQRDCTAYAFIWCVLSMERSRLQSE